MSQPKLNTLARQYDKLIKECLTESLSGILTHALHIDAQSTVLLDSKLQATEEREADFLVDVTETSGRQFLLHLEFQSTNDTGMSFRMLRYWLFIMQQYGKSSREVHQYVIYIGKAPMNMANTLSYERLQYNYPLIDMRSVSATPFLNSDKPIEIILAVLCDYQDQNLLVERILQRLKETVVEELRLSKYIRQLEIFSQLRNLQDTVYQKKSVMDFVYDIEKDPVYKEGEKRGEKRGEERGEKRGEERGEKRGKIQGEKRKALAMAQTMKQAGEPLDKIIAYTQLSHEEIAEL